MATLARISLIVFAAVALVVPFSRVGDAAPSESISITLDGPCLGYGWHNQKQPIFLAGADWQGIRLREAPHDLQQEWTAIDPCGDSAELDLAVGEVFGRTISQNKAVPFFGGGYRISLGLVDMAMGGGFLLEGKRRHPQEVHFGEFFPFFGVQFHGKF